MSISPDAVVLGATSITSIELMLIQIELLNHLRQRLRGTMRRTVAYNLDSMILLVVLDAETYIRTNYFDCKAKSSIEDGLDFAGQGVGDFTLDLTATAIGPDELGEVDNHSFLTLSRRDSRVSPF